MEIDSRHTREGEHDPLRRHEAVHLRFERLARRRVVPRVAIDGVHLIRTLRAVRVVFVIDEAAVGLTTLVEEINFRRRQNSARRIQPDAVG